MNKQATKELFSKIEQSVDKLVQNFKEFPDIYLTEEDARTHLFSLILKNSSLCRTLFNTQDGTKSTPLHSEIRWYGNSGKLKYRSDIVILDPRTMITKKSLSLPSKGYGFNHFYAIIEIKLRRVNGKSDNKFSEEIVKEIEKLNRIRAETKLANKYNPLTILICLDKRNNISNKLPHISEDDIEIRYALGDIK